MRGNGHDTPLVTWVVVWWDDRELGHRGAPELHAELWETKEAAEAVAKVYQARGQHAWAVCLKGEGDGKP